MVISSQGLTDSATVEKLNKQIKEIENSYKVQLKNAEIREKDIAAKYAKIKEEVQDINIEMQRVK